MLLGHVTQLLRYPVKSLAGEDLAAVDVDLRGVVGDRTWAVRTPDGGLGSGKDSRRFRRVDGLLDLKAWYDAGSVPCVGLPDGRVIAADDPDLPHALSTLLGRRVAIAAEEDVPHHDESPLHLVTTAALRHLAGVVGAPVPAERFRPNVVVGCDGEGFVEDGWHGREVRIGAVRVALGAGMTRCRMVDLPQPHDGLGPGGGLLRTLGRLHDVDFGLTASVVRGGRIRVGDEVRLIGPVARAGA